MSEPQSTARNVWPQPTAAIRCPSAAGGRSEIMLKQRCSVDVHVRNGVARVAVLGELDPATTPVLVDRLTHLERTDVEAILVDLRETTFLDSSAIHAFLTAHDHAEQNGHRFILVGGNARAQRVFGLTSTEYLLHENGTAEVVARFTRLESSDPHRDPAAEVSP